MVDPIWRWNLVRGLSRNIGAFGLVALVAVAPLGCDDDDDEFTGPSNAPASHTISQDGVRHLPGLNDPAANCVACHGADLRGGNNGEPSCFTCHGQEWP
jgi:cytochrome c553